MTKPLIKIANAIDVHVSSRLRMRCMMLGMSQEKLGNALGITFQQVQKDEKGTNRMGASRLQQAANVLGVAAPFFFERAEGDPYKPGRKRSVTHIHRRFRFQRSGPTARKSVHAHTASSHAELHCRTGE